MICVLRKTAKNRDSKNQRAVQRERYRSGTGHRSGTVRAVHGSGTASGTVQRYRTVQDRTVQDGRYRDGTRTVRRYYDGTTTVQDTHISSDDTRRYSTRRYSTRRYRTTVQDTHSSRAPDTHISSVHPTVQSPTVQSPTVQDTHISSDGTESPTVQEARRYRTPTFPGTAATVRTTVQDGRRYRTPTFQRRYRTTTGRYRRTVQDTHISSDDTRRYSTRRYRDGTGHPPFQRRHPTVQHPTVQDTRRYRTTVQAVQQAVQDTHISRYRYRTPTFPATVQSDGTAPDGTDGTATVQDGTGHPHFQRPPDGTGHPHFQRRYRTPDGTQRTTTYRIPTFRHPHFGAPTFRRTFRRGGEWVSFSCFCFSCFWVSFSCSFLVSFLVFPFLVFSCFFSCFFPFLVFLFLFFWLFGISFRSIV
jgi:hypothetical protein